MYTVLHGNLTIPKIQVVKKNYIFIRTPYFDRGQNNNLIKIINTPPIFIQVNHN